MDWLLDHLRTAARFGLGAVLPFLGLVFLGFLGALLLVLPAGKLSLITWPAGVFLLGNALLGLAFAFRSFPRPPGRTIKPGEAPALEAQLEALRSRWKGPAAPQLILAPDAWSLELTGVPMAGLFGWCRHHWYIGIYPLLALSLEELQAVAEWEVVFWSGYHGWLNLETKRLASFWYRTHLRLAGARGAARVFSVFLRPYSGWLVAGFQPFLAQEFLRADQTIADQQGAPVLARALCRLAVLKPLVTRRVFVPWDASLDRAECLPADLYGHLGRVLAAGHEGAEGMLELALDGLEREAPPLLRMRLDYLQARARVPLPPGSHAFAHLLEGTPLAEEIAAAWRERMWTSAQDAAQRWTAEARRFRELDSQLEGSFPDHASALEYLTLAFDHAPGPRFDTALEIYRTANPACATTAFLSIRRSLDRGRDNAAVFEARELIHRDPAHAPDCHRILAHHLQRRGDILNADKEWDRAVRSAALVERVQRERMGASLVDHLESHHCTPSTLQAIQRVCLSDERVAEAHLVRKRVHFHVERPVLLLVVRRRGAWWDPFGRKREAFLRELRDACPFPPGATGFIQVAGWASLWRFEAKLRRLNGLIFRR